MRVPMYAPTRSPTSASAPAMNPCAQPNSASSSDQAEMIQSSPGHRIRAYRATLSGN